MRNSPPRGACFTIEIPLQPAGTRKVPRSETETEPLGGGRILLVDQDDSVLEAAGALLREHDHEVEKAKCAADAMALLEKLEFSMVIADLELAGSGERNILHDWILARRPALSNRCLWTRRAGTLGEADAAVSHNGNRVLQKPFKADELLAAVATALGPVRAAPIEG